MKVDQYTQKAQSYLNTLCSVKPNRRTGSAGNWEATDFFADIVRALDYEVDATPFECLDYVREDVLLAYGDQAFEVFISPYSLGCAVTAELVTVSTVDELESGDCAGKILLMRGEICAEQLMPKNFVFYNPEHHQKIIALLESQRPAAIVTATKRSPDMVGAQYPFPLLLDGDFDIPSVYCTDVVGDDLARLEGELLQLQIDARRILSRATNVIARLNPEAEQKIVITAHIDAYEETPGASDNASGTIVLLLLAEMLAGYQGNYGIEIASFNGEDHYSVGGQMDYLRRYGSEFPNILLGVNVDDVGFIRGRASYSFYECAPELEQGVESVLRGIDGLIRGEPWFNGDHMIFVQSGVSCMAITAELMPELMRTVTHTAADTPDIIDCYKLVEVAQALKCSGAINLEQQTSRAFCIWVYLAIHAYIIEGKKAGLPCYNVYSS